MKPHRRRLSLESLECRLAPAVIVVTRTDEVLTPGSVNLFQAITTANNNPGPDIITFAPLVGGTITQNVFVLPAITGDTTILGPAFSRVKLTRDASQSIRLLNVAAGANVSISRFDFLNGAPGGTNSGGAIFNSGNLTLTDCRFTGNVSGDVGGAIFSSGRLRAERCTFSNNTAPAGNANLGGAVYNSGVAEILDSSFLNNSAGNSGGLFNTSSGFVTISGCLFQGNAATAPGSAGGGYHSDGSGDIANTTFSGNTSRGGGGGIFQSTPGSLTLRNVTLTSNIADSDGTGGGIGGGIGVVTGGTVTMAACLVAGNTLQSATGSPSDIGGAVVNTSSFNLIGADGGLTGISHNLNGNRVGTQASPIDAKLAPLADNGGPTRTHALLAGSPALNAALVGGGGVSPADFTTTDQRGRPRNVFFVGMTSGQPDIGAFEAQVQINDIADVNLAQSGGVALPVGLKSESPAFVTLTSSNQAVLSDAALTYNSATDRVSFSNTAGVHGTATVTVRATNATHGDQMTDTFTVTLAGASLAGSTVAENAAVNVTVGTLSATTSAAGAVTFALTNNAGGAFKVVGNQIQVADTSKLDFEAGASRTVTVQVLAGGVAQFTQNLSITITNVIEPPVVTVPAARIRVPRNGSFTFQNANRISVSSADATASLILVKLTVTGGRVFVPSSTGVTIVGQNTANVVVIGSRAAVNAAINRLNYAPVRGYVGRARLDITAVDRVNNRMNLKMVFFDVV